MKPRLKPAAVCLLLQLAFLHAQEYSFKHYGEESGLPNQSIRALQQDTDGYLWVGTESGLYRYDGKHFRTFTKADGTAFPLVEAIHRTAAGVLWVATKEGVTRLSGERFEKTDVAFGALAIASDASGRLYVGTSRGLLVSQSAPGVRARPVFTLYALPGEKYQGVGDIAIKDSVAWYTCGKRICRLQNEKVIPSGEWDIPSDMWEGLAIDPSGNVWARSRTRLMELPKGASRFVERDDGLPASDGRATLFLARDGQLWVPTIRGLAQRAATGWEIIGKARGLPISSVQCVYQDREDSIWIGTSGAGLARWLGYRAWESWTEANGLSSESVWGIRRDARDVLWAANDAGVNWLDARLGRWRDLRLPGLPAGRATSLAPAPDGSLWMGQPTGAVHLDIRRGVATLYGPEAGLANPWVTSTAVDSQGDPWVGTPSGLYHGSIQGGKFVFTPQALPINRGTDYIRACLWDRKGRLWAGGSNGLFLLEGGRWTRLTTRDGLLRDPVQYLAAANDGSVWIGYVDPAGVSRLDRNGEHWSWRHFSTKDGLRSDEVYFLGSDTRGWTWVGGDRGVDVLDGRSVRHLDHTDGLVWDDCNANAFWSDPDGSVWIGTSRGISHLRIPAGGLPSRSETPPVLLTAAVFGDQAVGLNEPVSVPWGRRSMQATFAALTFLNEDTVRFRYRIAGLNDQWLETSSWEVHLPSLPAGQYALDVQANAGRGWSGGNRSRLAFTIRPVWWRTAWFEMAALTAVVWLGRRFWQWRLRHILRRQMELEDMVADRTRKLEQEKSAAERERDLVGKQKVEIERLFHASQQAARVKDEFLSNMNHEIRTPLNGIIGMTELALETELTVEQRGCLVTARTASESLLHIIEDILDVSRAEKATLPAVAETFDLHELVSAVAGEFLRPARDKGLELAGCVSPGVPRRLVGDPGRLRRVLVKLLDNAIKFTAQGSVRVHADLGDGRLGVEVHFAIDDTGIGIPLEKQALIFEPFCQADGSHKRRHGGTGLGLAICARFVESMGGRIWVESGPDRGSRFHFTVRFDRATEPAETRMREPQAACNAKTGPLAILLAEDNPVNQALALRLLQKRGHSVVTAANGIEALAALERQQFDVVLMDVQMPEMDGLEATGEIRIREHRSGGRVPIIAVTAHALEGDRERCLSAGMDDYVTKPIRAAELFAAIERHVGQAPAQDYKIGSLDATLTAGP